MSVKIIVDSTVDLIPDVKARVKVVPLSVRFGEQEYLDSVTITAEKFYEMLVKSEQLPTTSQPTPAAFEDVYRKEVEAGNEVVCITIASKLSGTYQSATIAAEEFPDKVFVVDSRTAAIGSGILAEYALELADKGMGGEQILNELIEMRKKIRLYFMVDTLEYLKKGGRLSSTVALVGGLLNIKPILHVDEAGEIKMLSSARGMKKAFSVLTELSSGNGGPDFTKPVMLAYTGESDENLRKYMEENTQLWAPDTRKTIVGSAIGVHVGPGAVAAAFFSGE
ncbi:MAG: DegV family protein [Oscillospiraceae bacterium]|nr:DegV family protein [Oscillospiraceae bacterium]